MSLINSILGPLSPRLRSPSEEQYELPFHTNRASSPAFPPPPITSSIYASPTPDSRARVPDNLLAIQRKARHLEEQLQELLDAQADGLMAGLGQGLPEDQFSTGSSTPTVSSIRGGDTSVSDKLPSRRKRSLAAARRGISRRIQQLAAVKEEEAYILDGDVEKAKAYADRTALWDRKRNGLEQRIRSIEENKTGSSTRALEEEAKTLEENIKELEEKLWAMKAKHRRVLDELADSSNTVEAKLASYKTSLSLLDSEVANFLTKPPDSEYTPSQKSGLYSLPAKRRTLTLAKDYWQEEQARLEEKCLEVDVERAALEEGVGLWEDVLHQVTEFESSLQRQMKNMAKKPASRKGKSPVRDEADTDTDDLLVRMDKTIGYLEEKLAFADSKSWNLLVCCIGAELEAFKEGRDLLDNSMSATLHPTSDGAQHHESPSGGNAVHTDSESGISSESELNRGSYPQKPTEPFFDTDTDDDPDPELLISHQDTDTDN